MFAHDGMAAVPGDQREQPGFVIISGRYSEAVERLDVRLNRCSAGNAGASRHEAHMFPTDQWRV